MFKLSVFRVAAVFAALSTLQPVSAKEIDLGSQLPPMAKPKPMPVGAVSVGKDQSGVTRKKLVSANGQMRTYVSKGGCKNTLDLARGYFAPAVSWENCGGRPGKTTFHGKSGNIWPLSVGKSERYKATGKTKSTWSASRVCTVAKQVRIKTHTGTHDTFKVVCRNKWATYTYYMSPKLGRTVKYTQRKAKSQSKTTRRDWELTRIEMP